MSLGLKITHVQNEHENRDRVEKIYVIAQRDVNLNNYLVYDSTFDDEEHSSNKGRHVYRFPTHTLLRGQQAVIWVAKGPRQAQDTVFGEDNDVLGYRFYWQRSANVINNTGDKLTLIEINDDQLFEVAAE